ncbi:MAG: hypothetical protein HC789_22920 [Microcoleus sp. CSU_2_2]|nr:hypothetical protein [Microcoleus sp. CSU_2_2]
MPAQPKLHFSRGRCDRMVEKTWCDGNRLLLLLLIARSLIRLYELALTESIQKS